MSYSQQYFLLIAVSGIFIWVIADNIFINSGKLYFI
jgi:hypothetical protein